MILTNLILLSDKNSHTFYKGTLRFMGTLGGGVLGLCLVNLIDNNIIYSSAALFFVFFFFVYYSFQSQYYYALLFAGITFFLTIGISALAPKIAAEFIVWRIVEITAGFLTSAMFSLLLPPTPKQFYYLTKEEPLRSAIKVGISAYLAFFLCILSGWFSSLQGVISSLVVSQEGNFKYSHLKGLRRFSGCLLGAGIGLAYLHFVEQSLMTISLAIFIVSFVLCYCQCQNVENGYVFLQASIAFFLAVLPANATVAKNIYPALERLAGIFFGVGTTILVNYFVFPKLHVPMTNPRSRNNH